MAHAQETKTELRRKYVFEQLSLASCAVACDVSYGTAQRWKKQAQDDGDDWDKLKSAYAMAGGELEDIGRQILTDFVLQFKSTMDIIREANEIDAKTRVELLTSLADSYNKAIAANKRLLPETSRLAVALEVLERLAAYIGEHKPTLLAEFLAVLEPFGEMIERELK